jgi:hypothetical protein
MIFNETLQKAISNLGWVDKGSLWIYDGIKKENIIVQLSDSQYLVIADGKDGYFSVIHNYEGSEKIEISIHHFEDIQKEYCRISFQNFKTHYTGDLSFCQFVPRYYVAGLTLNSEFNFHLLKISNGVFYLEDEKIDWYTNGDFDFMYQGLTGVTEFNNELIFTVQRDGSLFRYSLGEDKLIDKVNLAGSSGNPQPKIIGGEIWVTDYDTLVKMENWEIQNRKRFQGAHENTSQFIGDFSFNKENGLCILARPLSGDVIGLNKYFRIKYTCNLGKQPLQAVLMKDQVVIARDWQTGDLLIGKMKRKWF